MSKPGNVITSRQVPTALMSSPASSSAPSSTCRPKAARQRGWRRSEDDPISFFIVDLFSDGAPRSAHFEGSAAALILGEGGPLLASQPEISAVELLAGKNV
jgi:hypothetical protein